MTITIDDLRLLTLPLGLGALLLIVLLVDISTESVRGKTFSAWVTFIGLCALLVLSFWKPRTGLAFGGRFCADAWTLFLSRWFLVAGSLVSLGGMDRLRRMASRRQGEYSLLLLFSLLGMVLLTGALDLILLILCFELASIPLFVMSAIEKRKGQDARLMLTAEGSIKFFLVGVVSTPIALLGLALVLCMTGDSAIAALQSAAPTPLFRVGVLLLLAGMGFKIGVVPFHMWVPDTYQSAPAPFVAFLSTAPKFTALIALARVLISGLENRVALWVPALTVLCIATLIMANFWALGQRNTKRLLAYSGIGHIGYFIMALLVADNTGLTMFLFYLVAYLLTNIGVFLVVEAVAGRSDDESIDVFAGLARRSPWLALSMLLFLLSLAGIPFVVGFWAKLYVFIAAWRAGYAWLVVAGALLAIVALYYYLQIARVMYMSEPKLDGPCHVKPSLALGMLVCLLGVVGFGAYPRPLLESAQAAADAFTQVQPAIAFAPR